MTVESCPKIESDPPLLETSHCGVYEFMRESAYRWPDRIAIQTASRSLTYSELIERVEAQAALLCDLRVGPGDRIAILSENRIEYLELQLAAARIGAIVACQNWRLTPHELQHCINLVSPSILICSEKQHSVVANLSLKSLPVVVMGQDLEERLTAVDPLQNAASVDPESGLIILYTSGTTGRPKAALISQRALCWRMCLLRIDLGITPDDAYLAWSPMFHMGGTEHSLSTLMMGGRVILTEGFNAEEMAEIISSQALGWLLLVPATLAPLMSAVRANGCKVKGIKAVGSMADLIPLSTIAELTNLLGAPFFNSFGSTETGLPPASGRLIPVGEVPSSLSKSLSSLCSMRIIESEGNEVEPGGVGEAFVRGPTLFSGYWGDKAVNQQEFANGWFRMGDLFRRNLDGSVDFVGRAKYLIKSGGENIYPAEIENVLLADPGVLDAIVVRRADERWGEVPVAVVSRSDDSVSPERLEELCRSRLAGYKQPKSFYFVNFQDLPRSATGKIIREDIEAWLAHRNT